MVLLARLAAENPSAKTVTVTASTVSNIERKQYDETWKYDRQHWRFVWRSVDRETGGVTEYRYSDVTDEILTDIARRAADEFVDQSALSGYNCLWELVRNGRVVRVVIVNGRPVRGDP
ncbi:MAG: hypothetical protein GTN78_01735 [Gemmatimonadales bacterium]|nr:hypothetical protein [Gemmatimonadales bacterium]